jgi:hypothetical protein
MFARRLLLPLTLLLAACAGQKPIIYQADGSSADVEAAIAECRRLAEEAGARPTTGAATTARRTATGGAIGAATGAVGGAVAGNAGQGAAIGAATGATATLIRNLLDEPAPNPAYRGYVERCLRDRGYDVIGWQ